jgi:hypothetical protein
MTPEAFRDMCYEMADTCENGDLSDELRGTVPSFHNGFLGNFIRRQDPRGVPWAPHAPLTIRLHGVHPLLILSGAMLAVSGDEGSAGNITRVTDRGRRLELGIDGATIPYAITHQEGSDRVPQREFLYANDETVDSALERFVQDMRDRLFGWQLQRGRVTRQLQPVG